MSSTIFWSLLKLMSTEWVMKSNHLILCRPLLLPPSIFPSIRVFSNESALRMRWPKYWSFSFSISPSSEHPGLLSFRMDWLDLLAVQGTLRSLLQHHSLKALILQHQPLWSSGYCWIANSSVYILQFSIFSIMNIGSLIIKKDIQNFIKKIKAENFKTKEWLFQR